MTWNEVIMYIINVIIKLLVACVIPYLFSLARKHVKNSIQNKYLDRFEGIVKDTVDQVHQTFVANMKAENLFDKEAQIEAFEMVKATVLNTMNDEMKSVVMEAVGDFDEYIRNLIEAEVLNIKQNTYTIVESVLEDTNNLTEAKAE